MGARDCYAAALKRQEHMTEASESLQNAAYNLRQACREKMATRVDEMLAAVDKDIEQCEKSLRFLKRDAEEEERREREYMHRDADAQGIGGRA